MRGRIVAGGLVAVFVLAGGAARGQGSDAALRDRVAQLVERLESPKVEARDAAEAALIGLGARALPLLPESAKPGDADRNARLERIRAALGEAQDQANFAATTVTIRGRGIRLSEAIKQLQARTGNPITDLREQFGAEVTNPALDLEIVDRPFFEALDEVARKAGVTLNFFTGDGSIGLMAGPGEGAPPEGAVAPPPGSSPIHAGPFRVVLKRIELARDVLSGSASGNIQAEVAWEPRLRPMLLALKADGVAIVDDRGETVAPAVMGESDSVALRAENPAAELNIGMTAPDRQAGVKALRSLKVRGDVTVPAALKTFRFPSLAARDVSIQQGKVQVTLASTEVEESTWKVNVAVVMPGEGPAFESFRQGLFNNRLWLLKPDGSRFEHNGGFSNTAADGGRLGFEYLFVDAPGKPADYQLVYETPSRVIQIPLEFEFKDVPLP
ncbi:MAG TPA: hypothetical protein VF590_27235 [Isosphaeraceae bacterium]